MSRTTTNNSGVHSAEIDKEKENQTIVTIVCCCKDVFNPLPIVVLYLHQRHFVPMGEGTVILTSYNFCSS